jgi:Fe-S cluster assembly protein SufD
MSLPQKIIQAKHDATDVRLAQFDLPDGAAWITEARTAAVNRVKAMGLPHGRDEYWKFTKPDTLVQPEAPKSGIFDNDEGPLWDDTDRLKIVFVDGVFDVAESDDFSAEGLVIERLPDAANKDIHWAKDIYGVLEIRGQDAVHRPLAALNTAFATDGVLIHVTGKVTKPVNLIYHHNSDSSDVILHHCIKIEDGAEMTLLETGPGAARLNTVMEVDVADKAAFNHVRVQGRDHERRAVTGMFSRLGHESAFKSFTLTMNGVLTRNECVIELTGDNAIAHVAGACVGDGKDFHQDDTVFITHDSLNCESRQVFKKVLRNGATGVFQGKILVKKGAQKTDGYQISQALLLDDDSQFLAKPELEIYADDVACSHGSTTGAIDEDSLFYLQSRGVPKAQATDLLVLAFLAEALQEIENPALAEGIFERLEAWLARHGH